jgi:endonuclease/exonuclease/phosphatase family metal-dependent hydrolase
MAVFYKTNRIEVLSTNHFWLSDTPEKPGSSTWGNKNRRMVTWLRLKDRRVGNEFYLFNTHLDHQVQLAREKSAALIRSRVEALKPELPVILTGDFNAGPENEIHALFVKDGFFTDSWSLNAEQRSKGLGSFNGFKAVPGESERIDWILLRGAVVADVVEINTFSRDGHFPSDHCPAIAWVRLTSEPGKNAAQ